MLRNFSISIGMILLVSVLLYSCNDHNFNQPGNTGEIKFDTAVAARSVIPISQAIAFQQSFINTRTELSKLTRDTTFLTKNFNLPNGEAFSKDALLLLLSQKDADAVRVYYGKDSKGVVRLVLLPITKDGKVIYNKLITSSSTNPPRDTTKTALKSNAVNDSDAEAVETGQTCPPCLINPQQE